ncbi:hypothetical protein [Denitratisoma sp. agr-D3]
MNSNEVNNAFSEEARRCHARLAQRLSGVGAVTATILADRLVQRVLELGRLPYAQQALQGHLKEGTVLDMGAARLQTGSGRVLLSLGQWGRGVLQFLAHWMYCLIAMLWVRPYAVARGPVTLVTGIGEESLADGGGDTEFAAYCRNGPIAPLRDAAQLYIQTASPGRRSTDPRIRYVRRPLFELIRCARLGLPGRLQALAEHFQALPRFLAAAARRPELALLGRDFAYIVPAMAVDNAAGMAAVVLTCTSISEQSLWGRCLRHARVHMVWYAQNWKPVVFKEGGVESDIPFLRWIRADVHWVWTKTFARYLSNVNGCSEVRAVGPIIWRLPIEGGNTISQTLYLGIFDISPYDDQVALSYCESPNFNGPANLTRFVQALLAVRRRLEDQLGAKVVLRFKTKRGYRAAYDRKYFDFIESLADGGQIEMVHYAANLFQMISQCHAVIAYPFTSPPYVAAELGVPSTFFDPTQCILQEHFADEGAAVAFAGNDIELENWLLDCLKPAVLSAGELVASGRALWHSYEHV